MVFCSTRSLNWTVSCLFIYLFTKKPMLSTNFGTFMFLTVLQIYLFSINHFFFSIDSIVDIGCHYYFYFLNCPCRCMDAIKCSFLKTMLFLTVAHVSWTIPIYGLWVQLEKIMSCLNTPCSNFRCQLEAAEQKHVWPLIVASDPQVDARWRWYISSSVITCTCFSGKLCHLGYKIPETHQIDIKQ